MSLITCANHRAPRVHVEQCVGVDCGLDTLRTAIEETNAKSVLKVGHRLRYGRLGDRQARGRLGHTPPAHNGGQSMKVAQRERAQG